MVPIPGLRTGTNDSVSCELPLAWLTGQSSAGAFQGRRQRWRLSTSNWRTSTVGSSRRAPAGAASNSEGSCWQRLMMTAGGHMFLSYVLKNPQVFKSWMGTCVWDLKSRGAFGGCNAIRSLPPPELQASSQRLPTECAGTSFHTSCFNINISIYVQSCRAHTLSLRNMSWRVFLISPHSSGTFFPLRSVI